MADAFLPPDTINDPYGGNGPLLMGVTWSLAIIALALMGCRTYSNAVISKHFSWDYLWAVITLVCSMVGQILQTLATRSGLANHMGELTLAEFVTAMKWAWIGQIVILNAIGFGKVAICAFLLRIQDRSHSKGKWFLYFVAISGLIINLDQTILMLVQCTPSARQWDRSLPGTCDHVQRTAHVGYFQGSWAAASDFALAIYPLVEFRHLKVSMKVRMAMVVLFGGGVLAGVASAIKTVHIKLIGISTDITYGVYDLVVWGLVECWLVLILGCLPSLRSLFVRTVNGMSASKSRPSRAGNQGYRRSKGDGMIAMYPSGAKNGTGEESHESEECIIPNDEGILKTTDIHITRNGSHGGHGGGRGIGRGHGDDKDLVNVNVLASPV